MSAASSSHADALAVLRAWTPPTPEQAQLRERYVALLERRHDAMSRDCRPDHLTASTLVLDESAERVLLTLHAKSGRWFQLGGHVEPGDSTLAGAALREALEESGLTAGDLVLDPTPVVLDAHDVPFCWPGEGVQHLDVMFVARARAGADHVLSQESLDLAWWPVDSLPNAELTPFVALAGGALAAGQASLSLEGGSTSAPADHPSR
ncbi:NUDIX domain-containing protein [Nocardioides seonyuensis]|uniref:NUDIX domain-containing protein n=1 Tax=Nocardioides seonyuensis TaxID=2518371 RepID=A0A4P7IGD3_9ACTN|nr:NUDIX domain-containing protein [Nocardioides seonyuensis]QBX56394.1 NUDIX domain-containing protein [Nocardioides seonyuensis]